jgi:hypothetical protein
MYRSSHVPMSHLKALDSYPSSYPARLRQTDEMETWKRGLQAWQVSETQYKPLHHYDSIRKSSSGGIIPNQRAMETHFPMFRRTISDVGVDRL